MQWHTKLSTEASVYTLFNFCSDEYLIPYTYIHTFNSQVDMHAFNSQVDMHAFNSQVYMHAFNSQVDTHAFKHQLTLK